MNNPLRHVGQTAHPEATPDAAAASPAAQPAGADPGQPDNKLGQHPTTTDNHANTPAAGKPAAGPQPPNPKTIKDLEAGEPPPESSAGS